jgi:hypothetical protein
MTWTILNDSAHVKSEIERLLMLDLLEGERLRPPASMAWGEVEFICYHTDVRNECYANMKLDNGIIYGVDLNNLLKFQRTKNFRKVYGKKEEKPAVVPILKDHTVVLPFWFNQKSHTF